MILLALDIGERRTGAALFQPEIGFVVPLDTIMCATTEEIVPSIEILARERGADELIVGLPLLPGGEPGAQVEFVQTCVDALKERGFTVHTLDERYSTTREKHFDGDGYAAVQILRTFLDRRGIDN